TVFERLFSEMHSKWLPQRIATWAADPRTDVDQLRRALEDVIANGPGPEWEASSLRVDYLLAMRELDRPNGILNMADDEDLSYRIGGEPLPPDLARRALAARLFLLREPERSRRVLRLLFANWLTHVEIPDERHRRPSVRASFWSDKRETSVFLYAA